MESTLSITNKSKQSSQRHLVNKEMTSKEEEGIVVKIAEPATVTSNFSGGKNDLIPKGKEEYLNNYASRKAVYLKKGRNNSSIHQVNSFINVFNSFVGDETKAKNKPRRSSILLHSKNSSTKDVFNELGNFKMMRPRKFSKNKFPLHNVYKKNRSKSEIIGNRKGAKRLARTLSDFHE